MRIRIREYTPADAEALARVWNENRESVVVLVQGTAGRGMVTGGQFGALRAPVAPQDVWPTVRYPAFAECVADALHYRVLDELGALP